MGSQNKFHNLPDYLSFKNSILHYEGINLLDLTNKYGTPLEVAYTDTINKKIKKLKNIFSTAIQKYNYQAKYYFAYATKANYYSEVISTSLNHTDFLETSSGHDLDIIEKLFIDQLIPKDFTIICNGFKKGYYFDKIVSLNKAGLNIIPVIENIEEAEMFLSQDVSLNVGMRINIDEQRVKAFLNRSRSASTIDTRFGIYFEEMVKYAHKINNSNHLKFKLFHFHLGGTIYDIKKYITFLNYLYEKNYCVLKSFSPNLEYFDIGGGLPTQYNLDFNFDYPKLVDSIIKNIKQISDKHKLPHPNIIGEHGRYTVADHSFFLYEISVIKKSNQDSYWYLINSSLMNYLPDSWALGQDFVILPLNLLDNKFIKVKLGGITCDPDDTYYKQEKKNYLKLPQVNEGEKLYIGVFGVGAYQEMIAGVGGVHHCMIPEGNELIIRKKGNSLEYNNINQAQSSKELLDILAYQNTHNLIQYLDKYNIYIKEHTGDLKVYYDKLKDDFPQTEIFPYKNLEKAHKSKQNKIILLYSDNIPVGYAFVSLLEKSKFVVLNYLSIFNEYRNKGYGHIFINELKSKYSQYYGLLVELEIPESEKNKTDLQRQLDFYHDLNFINQDFDYRILTTGSNTYMPMYIYVCNLKNNHDYEYKHGEIVEILNEYFEVIFDTDYQKQYKLNLCIQN